MDGRSRVVVGDHILLPWGMVDLQAELLKYGLWIMVTQSPLEVYLIFWLGVARVV